MPMQPSAEELELKQHVTKALATQGVLGNIKAQLRAAVFHVMHEHEPDEELADATLRLREFGRDGTLALELVLEFLEFFHLEHSLAVLTAEASVDEKERGRSDVRAQLGTLGLSLTESKGERQPLLVQLLHQKQSFGYLDGGEPHDISRDYQHAQQKTNRLSMSGGADRSERLEEKPVELPQSAKISSERPPLIATSRFDEDADDTRDLRRDSNDAGDADAKKGEAGKAEKEEVNEAGGSESESLASGSELDESIAEEQSVSLNYSQDYESASRDDASDLDDRVVVPTKLSSLPPLASLSTKRSQQDDDEFDEELEAERLSSLDAKLKAMEAEDETGTLQQLKATLQMELQQDDESVRSKSGGGAAVGGGVTDDEEHDGYGSDFEEEVISEVSDEEEIESVADLSENDESVSLSTLQPNREKEKEEDTEVPLSTLHDKLVDDENALNSYDYIEDVEKD